MEGSKHRVPTGYNDLHREFLQHLMRKRMLTVQETFGAYSAVYEKTYDDAPTPQDLEAVITLTNRALKGLGMELRMIIDEVTEEKYYALIPTMGSPSARAFVKYTSTEIEFFKRIIVEILNAEDSTVSSTFCLNLNSSLPGNVSKSSVEKLIKRMCDEQWLICKESRIRLSPLAIVELDHLLKETFKDQITTCTLCNHIVLQGSRCENCNSAFHSYCISRFIRTFDNGDFPCPSCNKKMAVRVNLMDIDE